MQPSALVGRVEDGFYFLGRYGHVEAHPEEELLWRRPARLSGRYELSDHGELDGGEDSGDDAGEDLAVRSAGGKSGHVEMIAGMGARKYARGQLLLMIVLNRTNGP